MRTQDFKERKKERKGITALGEAKLSVACCPAFFLQFIVNYISFALP